MGVASGGYGLDFAGGLSYIIFVYWSQYNELLVFESDVKDDIF